MGIDRIIGDDGGAAAAYTPTRRAFLAALVAAPVAAVAARVLPAEPPGVPWWNLLGLEKPLFPEVAADEPVATIADGQIGRFYSFRFVESLPLAPAWDDPLYASWRENRPGGSLAPHFPSILRGDPHACSGDSPETSRPAARTVYADQPEPAAGLLGRSGG
jgi:hypothetical protein